VYQLTAQARLGTTFSIFFYNVLRVIATLAIRRPEIKVTSVEPIFDEMLAVAHILKQFKQEVSQRPLHAYLNKAQ
jgi:hypothetical protein